MDLGQKVYLQCDVTIGRMEDEIGVIGKDYNGNNFSLYVDRVSVKEENGDYYLLVSIVQDFNRYLSIELPAPTINDKSKNKLIRRSQILEIFNENQS